MALGNRTVLNHPSAADVPEDVAAALYPDLKPLSQGSGTRAGKPVNAAASPAPSFQGILPDTA